MIDSVDRVATFVRTLRPSRDRPKPSRDDALHRMVEPPAGTDVTIL